MVKAVKLADIAEKLNVSVVTVSKALSGQKGVSEELREKSKIWQMRWDMCQFILTRRIRITPIQ